MNAPCGLEDCDCGHIVERLVLAMEEIQKAEGTYNFNRLAHAENTIEKMKRLAQVASRNLHR